MLPRSARNSRTGSFSSQGRREHQDVLFEKVKPIRFDKSKSPKRVKKVNRKVKVKKKSKGKKVKQRKRVIHDDLWLKKQSLIKKYLKNQMRTLDVSEYVPPSSNTLVWNNDRTMATGQHRRTSTETTFPSYMKPSFDNNVLAEDPFGRLGNSMHNRSASHSLVQNLQFNYQREEPVSNLHPRPPLLGLKKLSMHRREVSNQSNSEVKEFHQPTTLNMFREGSKQLQNHRRTQSHTTFGQATASFQNMTSPQDTNIPGILNADDVSRLERDLYTKLG